MELKPTLLLWCGLLEWYDGSKELLLELAHNEHGISGSSYWDKVKLHGIDVHHMTDVGVQQPLKELHHLVSKFKTSVVTNGAGHHPCLCKGSGCALLPVPRDCSIAEYCLC